MTDIYLQFLCAHYLSSRSQVEPVTAHIDRKDFRTVAGEEYRRLLRVTAPGHATTASSRELLVVHTAEVYWQYHERAHSFSVVHTVTPRK